jgi:hypothetical protein
MYQLDENEISFPDPALYDPEEGLLLLAEIFPSKEFGLPISWVFFLGLILAKKYCGGARSEICFVS